MNDRNLNPAYYEALAAARGVALIPARSWSILLTSANHGAVGPFGSQFPHAGERHERVKVVEIVEAGAAPDPGADLAGLVRLPLTNEQIDDVWDSLPSKFWRGQGEYEWNCEKRHAFARAIEREVAAQAGQVAVPEGWTLVPTHPDQFMINAFITEYERPGGSESGCYRAMLAAAPSAPAVAQQAPAEPTDLSRQLRRAASGTATGNYVSVRPQMLNAAAEEIERYYGGMMAWKRTAEKKDRDWQAERMERVNKRCAARAQASTAGERREQQS